MKKTLLQSVNRNGKICDIVIENNKFTKIVPQLKAEDLQDADIIDCSHFAIFPAFYNTHTHAAMTLLRGFADEVISSVAQELTDLLNKIKDESKLPEGIPNIEVKAFYDILKSVAVKYQFVDNFTEEQFKRMALEIKNIVDDKSQFIDWDKRDDIKAEMKVAIILTLAKEKYPPYTKDEVFKEIFEQAENFKKCSGLA